MTNTDYENLPWPARVRMARIALPKPTKVALADELGTTVHTIVNWESGKCSPKQQHHKDRIKELCAAGITVTGSKLNIDFLLGGIDANEVILTQPLLSRDKSGTTLALLAIATRLSSHIRTVVRRSMLVITIDTVVNTYPSSVDIHIAPVEMPDARFVIKLSHLPAGACYTLDLNIYEYGEAVSRYTCDISDSNIAKAIRILKKSINKLIKPNATSRSRIKQ
jgi:DNA-binding XRE family transcriptional regulator